jgi:hypothetical protein
LYNSAKSRDKKWKEGGRDIKKEEGRSKKGGKRKKRRRRKRK